MNLLADVMRGDLSESRHYGFIAVTNAAGEVLWSNAPLASDPVSFFRSSAKPLQAIPLVESGAAERFGLTDKELALACASHNGEPDHVQTALGILEKIGLGPEYLRCGADYPIYEPAKNALIEKGIQPADIYNNCSGKHSGMLMVCQHMGWPLENYTDPQHPLQQAILQVVSEFCSIPASEIQTGIDGCSVVCFGVSTVQMATAFARLADPTYWEKGGNPTRAAAVKRITYAMRRNAFMVAGSERGDTDLMNTLQDSKIFSKVGAEAVWCVGFPEKGLGLALKVEDGAGRAHPAILAQALLQTRLATEAEIAAFSALQIKPIMNKRQLLVGEYKPAFSLRPPQEW
jgi:L-asparaginase II